MSFYLNATAIQVGGPNPVTAPDFVSTDPSKPIRINGVVPSAGGGGGDVYTNQANTLTQVNTFNANTVLSTMETGVINTTGNIQPVTLLLVLS